MSMQSPHRKMSTVDTMKTPGKEERFFALIEIIMLQQAGSITKKQMINLHKMIRSGDDENLVVVQEIIKQKIDNFKDEEDETNI